MRNNKLALYSAGKSWKDCDLVIRSSLSGLHVSFAF
jgi:hypothetical protein